MKTAQKELSYKKIALFWLPLALTWLMMAIEQPFLQKLIARMPEQVNSLAAFGVSYAFALIIEAPVIMLMSASTALVKDRSSFYKLRKFSYSLCIIITLVLLLILIPWVFDFIAIDLIGLTDRVAELTYHSLLALIPWGGAIGYRRLYQGILIRNNQTRKITYGTIVRLVVMSGSAILISLFEINGALMGAIALSLGVITEATSIRIMASESIRKLVKSSEDLKEKEREISLRFFIKFYTPLAMTSILTLGVHPFISFMLAKSRFPLESLAVLPVINGITFLFRSLGLAYQEVYIALVSSVRSSHVKLRNFASVLGICVTGGLGIIAFTPISDFWFKEIAELKPELSIFAGFPLMIMAILPGLSVLQSFQRACLVNARKTGPVSTATFIEVVVIGITLWISIAFFNAIGVYGAAISYVIGRICANIYLTPKQLKASVVKPEANCA